MEFLVDNGYEISLGEFILNSLFYKKSVSPERYPDKESLNRCITSTLDDIEDYLEIKNNSLAVKENCLPTNENIERIGESISISVISKIIGNIDADWDIVPIISEKSFDFIYSVSDEKVVQIEAKGCFSNESTKSSAISNHKKSILEKKEHIKTNPNHPYKSDCYYGVITQISNNNQIKCFLLDPPSDGFFGDRLDLKIKNRFNYYHSFLSFISPNSNLTKYLHSIIKEEINYINKEPLPYSYMGSPFNSFTYKKLKINIGDLVLGGSLVFYKNNKFIFIGIDSSVINNIADGNILSLPLPKKQYLNELNFNIDKKLSNVEMVEVKKALKSTSVTYQYELEKQLKFTGNISISNSGIAIGILNLHSFSNE